MTLTIDQTTFDAITAKLKVNAVYGYKTKPTETEADVTHYMLLY